MTRDSDLVDGSADRDAAPILPLDYGAAENSRSHLPRTMKRVCEALSLVLGVLAAACGVGALHAALVLKVHGFELAGAVVGRVQDDGRSIRPSGPFNGCVVHWLRKERWGPVSPDVELMIALGDRQTTTTIHVPCSIAPPDRRAVDRAMDALAGDLRAANLFSVDDEALHAHTRDFIEAALNRESGKVLAPGDLSLLGDGDAGHRVVIETDYPYFPTSSWQVLTESLAGAAFLGLGLLLAALSVMAIVNRPRSWIGLVAVQSALSMMVIGLCLADHLLKPWDAVLGPANLGMGLAFGAAPLVGALGYAVLAKRHPLAQRDAA